MQHIIVSGGCEEIEGYVADDADMDGVFTITEAGTGDRFKVHGWNVTIEHISP